MYVPAIDQAINSGGSLTPYFAIQRSFVESASMKIPPASDLAALPRAPSPPKPV